ncbi:MAG: hypothetical protein Ct9H300mP23_03370 [Nitrospinota bacterium]|nr:MAG: hypothetical protein Ct9H300mP23_03370 [Nitrospinota bacterium]
MKGASWYFDNFESAAESSLAESLFSLDDVETVLVCESTVTVTRKDKTLLIGQHWQKKSVLLFVVQ